LILAPDLDGQSPISIGGSPRAKPGLVLACSVRIGGEFTDG
jgi:hypothetical protein